MRERERETKKKKTSWECREEQRRLITQGALEEARVNIFGFNPSCTQLALGLLHLDISLRLVICIRVDAFDLKGNFTGKEIKTDSEKHTKKCS